MSSTNLYSSSRTKSNNTYGSCRASSHPESFARFSNRSTRLRGAPKHINVTGLLTWVLVELLLLDVDSFPGIGCLLSCSDFSIKPALIQLKSAWLCRGILPDCSGLGGGLWIFSTPSSSIVLIFLQRKWNQEPKSLSAIITSPVKVSSDSLEVAYSVSHFHPSEYQMIESPSVSFLIRNRLGNYTPQRGLWDHLQFYCGECPVEQS